ncbi:MAG TPA: hypothetical protein VGC06_29805 [Actinomycetes bacterium]
MQIILVRHGSRRHDGDEDSAASLSEAGKAEVEQLASALRQLGTAPTVCLTSTKLHAEQTGEILTAALRGRTPLSLEALDRTTPAFDLFGAVRKQGVTLSPSDVVVIAGHEPALGQLAMNLTSSRHRPLHHAEAVCLAADDPLDFLKGRAKIEYRHPAVDYQEASLREKIRSKAHIATFLAGFTFSALIELLLGSDARSGLRIAAIICLTLALALFVGSIYAYDTLGMPQGYWLYGGRSRRVVKLLATIRMQVLRQPLVWRTRDERQNEHLDQTFRRHGPLYVYMVSTWRVVFTPAVLLALAGFIALVLDTSDWRIYLGAALSLVAVTLFYLRVRPDLGID